MIIIRIDGEEAKGHLWKLLESPAHVCLQWRGQLLVWGERPYHQHSPPPKTDKFVEVSNLSTMAEMDNRRKTGRDNKRLHVLKKAASGETVLLAL